MRLCAVAVFPLCRLVHEGYVFESSAAIRPHLEKPRTGPTSLFCSELAKRLQCYVVAGYPEALSQDELCSRMNDAGDAWLLEGANSAIVYGPAGEWVGGYRKTNLFKSDLPWAKAGRSNLLDLHTNLNACRYWLRHLSVTGTYREANFGNLHGPKSTPWLLDSGRQLI